MRILHVIYGELYSGAERVQDLLVLCLHDFACGHADLTGQQVSIQ